MPSKSSEIENLLVTKFGFTESLHHSVDHRWYELYLPGVGKILTMVSHGKKEIGKSLEGKMARQLRVQKEFYRKMMDCTRSREDYYRQLNEDPRPPIKQS